MALLFHSEVDDPEEWREELSRLVPSLDFRVWPEAGNPGDIDLALVWSAPPGVLAGLPNLKLILSLGVGADHVLEQADISPEIPVVRLVDAHCAASMTEFVLLNVLRFHRRDPVYVEQQRNRVWKAYPTRIAPECRVGIMGLGSLGVPAARALQAVGFPVAGWSRSAKSMEGIACSWGDDGLDPFLGSIDILVCLLALTPETRGILNARAFGAMPRGAYVINAARGGHLVEEDLLAALESGQIAGAALDTTRTEPLPADHPFWDHPGIVLTPHAATGTNAPSAARHVAENIRRFHAGEPLLNTVDRQSGY